jgi:hypothetical protein
VDDSRTNAERQEEKCTFSLIAGGVSAPVHPDNTHRVHESFFASLTRKHSARTFYGHTRRCLETSWGTRRPLQAVKPADADAWRAWLVPHDLATVCRWIGNSPEIAVKRYAIAVGLDADFRRATGWDWEDGVRGASRTRCGLTRSDK